MEKLDLGKCGNVTDNGAAVVLENFPFLNKLNLQTIDKITDNVLVSIEKFARNGGPLKVYLAECENVVRKIDGKILM